jgi:hypothetical protein
VQLVLAVDIFNEGTSDSTCGYNNYENAKIIIKESVPYS